jgi:hypothetical protein
LLPFSVLLHPLLPLSLSPDFCTTPPLPHSYPSVSRPISPLPWMQLSPFTHAACILLFSFRTDFWDNYHETALCFYISLLGKRSLPRLMNLTLAESGIAGFHSWTFLSLALAWFTSPFTGLIAYFLFFLCSMPLFSFLFFQDTLISPWRIKPGRPILPKPLNHDAQ